MAISATHLTTNGSNTSASSYATASISPTANHLILAWVTHLFAGTPNTPTLTGNSLTWVQVATLVDGAGSARTTLFRAMGSSPTSGAVTIDLAGQATFNGCEWSIIDIGGTDTSGTNGSGAVVQSATATVNTSLSCTVTLAAFATATNGTVGGFAVRSGDAFTAGSGFTILGQNGQNLSISSEWRSDNSTSVAETSGSETWTAIAAEIAVPPAVTPFLTVQFRSAV